MTTQDTFGCCGNTIRLRSGLYFDFNNPQPDQFTLRDIAGGLSKICRFGGQCSHFYSVAEHSVQCYLQAIEDGLGRECRLACLFHDATEAFCGDMVKPLKIMLPAYKEIEERIEAVIAEKFGIDFEATRHAWKPIDKAMLIAERKVLAADKLEWPGEREARVIYPRLNFLEPSNAEHVFYYSACALGI